MQIKPIIAAAGALACILLEWPAVAAGAPIPSGAAVNYVGQIATAGENFILQAMAEDDADAKTEATPEAMSEEQDITRTGKPAAGVSVHSTRPRIDRHRDARACLDAANNLAIIKCAEKYRYR